MYHYHMLPENDFKTNIQAEKLSNLPCLSLLEPVCLTSLGAIITLDTARPDLLLSHNLIDSLLKAGCVRLCRVAGNTVISYGK